MPSIEVLAALALATLNLVAFATYGVDKGLAKLETRRVSERTLLALAFSGGVGAWVGMLFFRHKTQKNRFRFGVPALAALQVVVVLGLAWWAGVRR